MYVSSLRAGSIYILDLDNNLKKIVDEDRLFFKEQRIRDLEYDPELDVFFILFESVEQKIILFLHLKFLAALIEW